MSLNKFIDLSIVKNTNKITPPQQVVAYGKASKLGSHPSRIPSYSENISTPYECFLRAAYLLTTYNGALDIKDPTYDQKNIIASIEARKQEQLNETVKVRGYTATFYADRAKAPFNEQCHIEFGEAKSVDTDENAITIYGGWARDEALWTPCMIPFKRDDCLKSNVSNIKPKVCTGITAEAAGNTCRNWYFSLPSFQGIENASIDQTHIVEDVCNNYPDLVECDCYSRNYRTLYNQLKSNFTTSSPNCWYRYCNVEGFDRLIPPKDREARANCSGTVCQNIVNIINGSNNSLDELQQAISCTPEEWKNAEKTGGGTSGGGGGTSGGDGTENTGDNNNGGMSIWVIVAIVAVIVVIAIAVIVFLFIQKKKAVISPPPPPPSSSSLEAKTSPQLVPQSESKT